MSGQDEMDRGYYDIPEQEKLRSMSDQGLDVFLATADSSSPKYHAAKREQERRNAKPAEVEPPNKTPQWYEKPIGLIGIGVAISAIGAIVTFLLRIHFGIS